MENASVVPSCFFILESINEAVIVTALNGRILFSNIAAQRLFGYSGEEFLGQKVEALIPGSRGKERSRLVEQALWGERIENFETERLHKNNYLLYVSVSLSALKDHEGKTIGITTVLRNISEKRRTEGKFRALLESAPDAMVLVNRFGQIILINAQTQKLFGYEREDIIGEEIEKLIPERYWEKHPGPRKVFFNDPDVREMGANLELYARRQSGEEFPVEIRLSPLDTEEGTLVLAAIRDVSERKEAERILRQSDEKFNKAFYLSPVGIIMSNLSSSEIIEVNQSCLDIIGFNRDEVIGKTATELDLLHHEDMKQILKEVRKQGILRNRELTFRRKSGERRTSLYSLLIITLNDEKVVFSMFYDITERKKAEAELKRKSEDLSRSNGELEQFAYAVSHDLQAPLRSITGYLGAIERRIKDSLDEELRMMLEKVMQASGNMKTMIKELLNYSRIGKNNDRLTEQVDCNEVVMQVLADLDFDIKDSKATVTTDTLPVIKGNATEIKQLMQNLVSNAIKFRKNDQPPIIAIKCEDKISEWLFSVEDNGIGISEEYFKKLFLVFQRLHSVEEYPGMGIGLATCKKIVELLGGKIWLTSKEGVGSTFFFTIPKYNNGNNVAH